MKFTKHLPLIIAPYSKKIVGGISSWTNIMISYSNIANKQKKYQIQYYSNQLMAVTNTKIFVRVITGIILYSKLVCQIFILTLRYKPTVFHVTTSATLGLIKDIVIIKLAKLTKTPIVMHWHFGRIPELAQNKNWEWRLLKYVVQNSNYSIVIDKKSYDVLLEQGLNNVINVPNPLPIDIEQRAKVILEQSSIRPPGKILFVGHVLRDKGVFELVEACTDIPEINELIILGPCEEDIKYELISLAKKRTNAKWLKMVGQQNKDNVLHSMSISQILILPSYTEGFPNVVIEAMAMGCAIVATDVGAIPEMIDFGSDRPCGICIPSRNVEKLKKAILELVENSEEARRMGNRGIEKVLNNYTIEKIVAQYLKIWKDASKMSNY